LPHAKKEVVYDVAHYLRLDLSLMSLHFYIKEERGGEKKEIFHSWSMKCVPAYNVIEFFSD
jgi:hypothetical protein